MSFFYNDYKNLITQFIEQGFEVLSVDGFLRQEPKSDKVLILRHDVDRFHYKSINFARFENSLNIKSTYYFRDMVNGFNATAIKYIADMGHDVGYHYETLARAKGNKQLAINDFEKNLVKFNQIAACSTVTMHGSPFSKQNNMDILSGIDFTRCGIVGDAVELLSKHQPIYLTDTGGKWENTSKNNLRDRLLGGEFISPSDTHFKDILKRSSVICVLSTHPERWSRTKRGFFLAKSIDLLANFLKRVISSLRKDIVCLSK